MKANDRIKIEQKVTKRILGAQATKTQSTILTLRTQIKDGLATMTTIHDQLEERHNQIAKLEPICRKAETLVNKMLSQCELLELGLAAQLRAA